MRTAHYQRSKSASTEITRITGFAVSDYDVAKYEYEQAVGRGAGSVDRTKNQLDELNQRKYELRLVSEASEREMIEQQAVISSIPRRYLRDTAGNQRTNERCR